MTAIALISMLLLGEPKMPEGPEKTVFLRVCGGCHDADVVTGMVNTRQGWTDLIEEMMTRGGVATPAEKKEIARYLYRSYPQPPLHRRRNTVTR